MLTVARLLCTAGAGLVTVIVPLITGPISVQYGTDAGPRLANVYFIVAIILCVVAFPMFLFGFYKTRERMMSTDAPPSLKHNLKLLVK